MVRTQTPREGPPSMTSKCPSILFPRSEQNLRSKPRATAIIRRARSQGLFWRTQRPGRASLGSYWPLFSPSARSKSVSPNKSRCCVQRVVATRVAPGSVGGSICLALAWGERAGDSPTKTNALTPKYDCGKVALGSGQTSTPLHQARKGSVNAIMYDPRKDMRLFPRFNLKSSVSFKANLQPHSASLPLAHAHLPIEWTQRRPKVL